jgi:hypothetical protein
MDVLTLLARTSPIIQHPTIPTPLLGTIAPQGDRNTGMAPEAGPRAARQTTFYGPHLTRGSVVPRALPSLPHGATIP